MVERKKNESGRRETEKGNKNDFWEICLAPFMFLQRHVSFFGGGGATWFETFGYLVKTVNGHSRLVHHGKKDGTFGY